MVAEGVIVRVARQVGSGNLFEELIQPVPRTHDVVEGDMPLGAAVVVGGAKVEAIYLDDDGGPIEVGDSLGELGHDSAAVFFEQKTVLMHDFAAKTAQVGFCGAPVEVEDAPRGAVDPAGWGIGHRAGAEMELFRFCASWACDARGAAALSQNYIDAGAMRLPKMAVPMRTVVEPSSMAMWKSLVMPMESSVRPGCFG